MCSCVRCRWFNLSKSSVESSSWFSFKTLNSPTQMEPRRGGGVHCAACNACNAAQCTVLSMTHSSSGRRRFRPGWVVTTLRNADVTWPWCARRLSCCQAAERRITWLASFLSNDSLAQPRRLPDRRFINFTWAEHLLKGSLWATGGELARSRRCLARPIGNVKAKRGRWLWLCVLPNIASLESVYALTFISQQRRRRSFLWTAFTGLRRVTRKLRLKGYSLPPLEVLLVRFEIGIHLEKGAECRNCNMILRVCHGVSPAGRTSRAPSAVEYTGSASETKETCAPCVRAFF